MAQILSVDDVFGQLDAEKVNFSQFFAHQEALAARVQGAENLYDKLHVLDMSIAGTFIAASELLRQLEQRPDRELAGEMSTKIADHFYGVLQKETLNQYANNPYVILATNGEMSLSDSLIDLYYIKSPNGPRKKDEFHNTLVERMEDLIGPLPHLKSEGFFKPDNAFNNASYLALGTGLATAAVLALVQHFTGAPDIIAPYALTVAAMSASAGTIIGINQRKGHYPEEIQKTLYLDNFLYQKQKQP